MRQSLSGAPTEVRKKSFGWSPGRWELPAGRTQCNMSFIRTSYVVRPSTRANRPVDLAVSFGDCRSFRFIQREASNTARASLMERENDLFPCYKYFPFLS